LHALGLYRFSSHGMGSCLPPTCAQPRSSFQSDCDPDQPPNLDQLGVSDAGGRRGNPLL
jgi:hypothetical protein